MVRLIFLEREIDNMLDINELRKENNIDNIKNIGIFVGPEGGIEEDEIFESYKNFIL